MIRKCIYILKFYLIHNTSRWKTNVEKGSLRKNKRYKKVLVFLSRSSTHHGFTFNSRFLNELKHRVRFTRSLCEIFHFRFHFSFIKVYIIVQQKAWTLWLESVVIPFKIKIIEKPHTLLLPYLWFWAATRTFKIQWYLHELELPKNWHGGKFFKLGKSKFWERQFLSVANIK